MPNFFKAENSQNEIKLKFEGEKRFNGKRKNF